MFGEKKKMVMCQACRALVDPGESVCPMCGNEAVPEQRVSSAGESGSFFSMLIIGINVLIFIMMGVVALKNGRGIESFVASADSAVLRDFGSFAIYLVDQGQWWRFVTANFLHIGLLHLLFNSYALYQVGPLVEEIYGEHKFIFVYLFTGIFCEIPSYYAGINGAGASGAISGLIGLLAVYGYRQGGVFGKALMKSMLTWMGMTIVYGFIIGANNVAHAGGFIAGGILGFLLKAEPVGTARAKTLWNALALLSILIFAVSFIMVGKHYGAVQEQAAQEPLKNQQAQKVIRLSNLVREGGRSLSETGDLSDRKTLPETAKKLRRVANDLSQLEKIDEPSDAIRSRLVNSLNKSADALEEASKSTAKLPVSVEILEYKKAFDEYIQWEDSVLEKYGLVKSTE